MKFKLGKHDPVQEHIDKALKFADYVPAELPVIPSMFDAFSNVYASLGVSDPAVLFPLDGNDTLGDCVMCAAAHAVTGWAGLIGNKNIPAQSDVEALYTKLSGGDNGLNISSTIDYMIVNGAFGEKPLAKVYIDPTNLQHVQLAIYLFGFFMTGIQCTDAMQQQFASRQPWDGSGTVEGGHGILAGAYYSDGTIKILTWGNDQIVEPGGWAMVDECWAIAPQEVATNPAKFSSLGFDTQQFLADLQAIQDSQ